MRVLVPCQWPVCQCTPVEGLESPKCNKSYPGELCQEKLNPRIKNLLLIPNPSPVTTLNHWIGNPLPFQAVWVFQTPRTEPLQWILCPGGLCMPWAAPSWGIVTAFLILVYGICHSIGAKLDRQKRDSLKVEESEIRHERTSYLPLGKACLERLIEAGGEVWSERPARQLFSWWVGWCWLSGNQGKFVVNSMCWKGSECRESAGPGPGVMGTVTASAGCCFRCGWKFLCGNGRVLSCLGWTSLRFRQLSSGRFHSSLFKTCARV